MLTRSLVAAALIVSAGIYASGASAPERKPSRIPLSTVPMALGSWVGQESTPLADDVVAQLGVDDYLNRRYAIDGGAPIAVYVGYYASQRQGDTIHSPQNCLPGAGWRPVFSDRHEVALGAASIPVNRFIIQKGLAREAVFYWYQGRGRSVANEFANKGWLMFDAARLRRTDGGLVRLITPVVGTPESAFASLTAFTAALLPQLPARIP
jgi:EpsI family protein